MVETTPQLSVEIIEAISGGGTSDGHCTVISAGKAVMTGAESSITVIVCVHVVALSHASNT